MSFNDIKSELQQVLDSDIALRKEFNELKRSLSDYRNQLILRDEDNKRLQVTIDVLNTKLQVMERDNTIYKSEITSFKELRTNIREQLQEKQAEIDARFEEINALKAELDEIAGKYESQIEQLKNEAGSEINKLKEGYETQLSELRSGSHYKEMGLKEEFENRINELTGSFADSEMSLIASYNETISTLKSEHTNLIESLKSEYENKINSLTSESEVHSNGLKYTYENTISEMETGFQRKLESIEQENRNQVNGLKLSFEEERSGLVSGYNERIDELNARLISKEDELKTHYEARIEELTFQLSGNVSELTETYENKIQSLTQAFTDKEQSLILNHENHIQELQQKFNEELESLKYTYEEKLSNTILQSNLQNTKLNEELSRVQLEGDTQREQIITLSKDKEDKASFIQQLQEEISVYQSQIENNNQSISDITAEFESYKQTQSLSQSEQVNHLNAQIEVLNAEVSNLIAVIENAANQQSETEQLLNTKTEEANSLLLSNGDLTSQISELTALLAAKENELDEVKSQFAFEKQDIVSAIESSFEEKLNASKVEFEKLLAENTNLIQEIELAQNKIEVLESELSIIKAELEETRTVSSGKVDDLKEILNNKNFEITNISANNSALHAEVSKLKEEIAHLSNQLSETAQNEDVMSHLKAEIETLTNEKTGFLSEMERLSGLVNELNTGTESLNMQIADYQSQIANLSEAKASAETEAFIDRLFKQIDALSDERLQLLTEKEELANQLLKMNEVISGISQNIDSQSIDVSDLNNHRKNVILAKSSGSNQNETTQMKKQINELVREIDKCIALLSA